MHRFRERTLLRFPQGRYVHVKNARLLNFCSNDYLGLCNHPEVIDAFNKGLKLYGVGSGASSLVCGYGTVHQALEQRIATITQRSRALLFTSGYLANLAIIPALVERNAVIIGDRLNHASMVDSAVLARARLKRFRHLSMDHFKQLYYQHRENCRLVITDGVFSMDGDIAPLDAIADAIDQESTILAVDDAHGFGVLGKKGGGIIEHYGLTEKEVPLLMATFGKALGGSGAFIAGEEAIIEQILQKARSYIYTTAMLPALACAMQKSMDLVIEEPWRREKLHGLIDHFHQRLKEFEAVISHNKSTTAIQPIMIGEDKEALRVANALEAHGILVTAIRPPTVPAGTARLRVTLTAHHETDDIDRLLEALSRILLNNKTGRDPESRQTQDCRQALYD